MHAYSTNIVVVLNNEKLQPCRYVAAIVSETKVTILPMVDISIIGSKIKVTKLQFSLNN